MECGKCITSPLGGEIPDSLLEAGQSNAANFQLANERPNVKVSLFFNQTLLTFHKIFGGSNQDSPKFLSRKDIQTAASSNKSRVGEVDT